MKKFQLNEIILETLIENEKWVFRIAKIYNPSQDEIESNLKYNDTLGNDSWKDGLPTSPYISIIAENKKGDSVSLWWDPTVKLLGPAVSKKGWSKGLFHLLQNVLIKIKLNV